MSEEGEGEDGGEDKCNPGFYSVRGGGGLSSAQLNGLSHHDRRTGSKHGKAGQGQGRASGGRGPTFPLTNSR